MTYIYPDVLPGAVWSSRAGASSLPSAVVLGMGLPAAGRGTGRSAAVVPAVPRVRGKAALVASPAQRDSVATPPGQTNLRNYMTRVTAVGGGASGPPHREPV